MSELEDVVVTRVCREREREGEQARNISPPSLSILLFLSLYSTSSSSFLRCLSLAFFFAALGAIFRLFISALPLCFWLGSRTFARFDLAKVEIAKLRGWVSSAGVFRHKGVKIHKNVLVHRLSHQNLNFEDSRSFSKYLISALMKCPRFRRNFVISAIFLVMATLAALITA